MRKSIIARKSFNATEINNGKIWTKSTTSPTSFELSVIKPKEDICLACDRSSNAYYSKAWITWEACNQLKAWGCVSKIETTNGSITATCFEDMPGVAIPIQLKVVR